MAAEERPEGEDTPEAREAALTELFAESLREALDQAVQAWLVEVGSRPEAALGFSQGFGEFVGRVLSFLAVLTDEASGTAWRLEWYACVEREVARVMPEARARHAAYRAWQGAHGEEG